MPVWTTKQWHEALFCLHFHAQQFRWPIQFRCLPLLYLHVYRMTCFSLKGTHTWYNKWPRPYWWRLWSTGAYIPVWWRGVTQSSGSVWQQQKCVVPKMPVIMGPSSTNRLGRKQKIDDFAIWKPRELLSVISPVFHYIITLWARWARNLISKKTW